MMRDFGLDALRQGYAEGRFSPVDVARDALARIAAYDPAVWISRVAGDDVLAQAAALRDSSLPLYGVPFAVKDNIDCAGLATTAGCPAFAYTPQRDAAVVAKLPIARAEFSWPWLDPVPPEAPPTPSRRSSPVTNLSVSVVTSEARSSETARAVGFWACAPPAELDLGAPP